MDTVPAERRDGGMERWKNGEVKGWISKRIEGRSGKSRVKWSVGQSVECIVKCTKRWKGKE